MFFFIVNFTDVVGILPRFSAQLYITRAGTLTKYKNILANILRPAVMERERISYEVGILAKMLKSPDCIFTSELPTRVY